MKRIRGVVLSFSLVFLFTVCLPQFDQQLLAQSTYGLITGAEAVGQTEVSKR